MIAVDIPSLKIIRNLNKPKSMTARANVQLTPAIGVRFRKFITTSTNRTTSVGSTTSSSVFFLRRVFGKEALDIDSAAITEGLEIRGTVLSLHGNDVCYKGGTSCLGANDLKIQGSAYIFIRTSPAKHCKSPRADHLSSRLYLDRRAPTKRYDRMPCILSSE